MNQKTKKHSYQIYCPTKKVTAFEEFSEGAGLEMCPVCDQPQGKLGVGCDFKITPWSSKLYKDFLITQIVGEI